MTSLSNYFTYLCYLSFISNVFCGVPVLIWESSSITEKEDVVPALFQLDIDEFSNHLTKKVHVHKPLIVVFLEETLSVEDFSWQDTKHRGAFPQIKNITSMSSKLEFIPSVDDPVASLKELMVSHNYIWKKYDGVKLPSESGIILEVKLKDPLNNEDRPDLLRRHDGNIADIYSQLLSKHSRIVALYSGKQSSWVEFESNRVRRDVEEDPINYKYSDFLVHSATHPTLYDGTSNITLPSNPELTADNRKTFKRLIATFRLNEEPKKLVLRLKFPSDGISWTLSEIEYERENHTLMLLPSRDIIALVNQSYESYEPIDFKRDTVILRFSNIKVDAYGFYLGSIVAKEELKYFTPAIWSALIVTFVLGMILTWGILMLLDVKTMDRFDDPKGKTITVNALD